MTTAGPWSVKGIDPKAREIAKDLARRSGMTLGEWLNHMIIEGDDEAQGQETSPFDRSWLDARTRTQAPGFSATESLRARINRELGRDEPPPIRETAGRERDARERDARERDPRDRDLRDIGSRDGGPRDVGLGHNSEAGELQRIGKTLAEISLRIEDAEHRATLQISGIDQQVMGVLSRVENAEREQLAAAARFETAIDDVLDDQGRLTDRLRRFDGDEAARMEALKALEGALTKVAGQIYEGESRAHATVTDLRADVAALARRVERTEAQPDGSVERRLEAVAAELTRKVDEVRGETTQRMKDTSDGRFDRLEGVIREISSKVGESEKRSGEAIDRMGREVVRVAQTMTSRVQAVEGRSAAATEQMGSEMARIAEAMEGRMRQADVAHSESLEKLGGELTRIAEKLADRIAASERRAAGSMTHMGDQLAGVTDSLNQRNDSAAADIAERIRASEERTAKLLAETREALDRRLGQTHAHGPAPAETAISAPMRPEANPPFFSAAASTDPFAEHDFAPTAFAEPEVAETVFAKPAPAYDDLFTSETQPDFSAAAQHDVFADFPPEENFETDPAFAHPDAYGPIEAPPIAEAAGGHPAMIAPAAPHAAPTTRDMIASARAAARAASESRGRRAAASADPFGDAAPAYDAGYPAGEFSAPEVAVAAERARTGVLGFGFPMPRRKRKEGPTLKTLLMASAVAATLSVTAVGAVGVLALEGKGDGKRDAPTAAPDPHAALASLERSANDPSPPAPLAPDTVASGGDRLAMAVSTDAAPAPPILKPAAPALASTPHLAPPAAAKPPVVVKASSAATASPTPSPSPSASPQALYVASVRQIEAKDAGGVEGLKKAANLGYAPAEFYLAKLFETGGSGLHKDAPEARRWTQRAADAGDAKAMHNLALYWFEGAGGPKDPAQAADWFKRAAERGVQDSQYNLARLYEQGFGVPKNAAEAYKWYLVAGASGDAEAKAGADALKRQLSPDAQAGAERAATGFRAQIAASRLRTASAE